MVVPSQFAPGVRFWRCLAASSWSRDGAIRGAALAIALAVSLDRVSGDARAQVPSNNTCANAIEIPLGSTTFSTVGATTDGPMLPQTCEEGFGLNFVQDVWFIHTATFSGMLEVSTCGTASFDTRLAGYQYDANCEVYVLVACNDDGAGCPLFTSIMQMPIVKGKQYLIRIGGFMGGGSGVVTLIDELSPICVPAEHDCFTVGLPGCSDVACCTLVCTGDPFCCVAAWDFVCVALAEAVCAGCGDADAGSCCAENGSLYCDDAECCAAVCAADPFCCEVLWDAVCAENASATPECSCDVDAACPGDGPCDTAHGSTGCVDIRCCLTVCNADPFCCFVEWDQICVDFAEAACDDTDPICGSSLLCLGDLDGDGVVDSADLGILLLNWGQTNVLADLDCNGVVDGGDIGVLLLNFGACAP